MTDDRGKREGKNDFIPNSFQTPNFLADRLMLLLEAGELRCVLFATRHIYGWQDTLAERSAVLSVSDFERGHKHRGGAGVGLGRQAILKALEGLANYRVMVAQGEPTPDGQCWGFGSSTEIDWAGLRKRREDKLAKGKQRVAAARAAKVANAAKRSDGQTSPGLMDRPAERSDGQTSKRSVGQTATPYIKKKHKKKPKKETQSAAESPESTDDPPDAAAEKEIIVKALTAMGLGQNQHAPLLALDAATALALIWLAQDRGDNPPGLLLTMIRNGDTPPVALRELAASAIRAGVHVKADAEKASHQAAMEELNQRTYAELDKRRAEQQAGGEKQADPERVLRPRPKKERPSDRMVKLWREWWPETAKKLKAAGCPDFLFDTIKNWQPHVTSDGIVQLTYTAWTQSYAESFEGVRQRLQAAHDAMVEMEVV